MQKTGNELTYDYDFYALNGLLSFLRLIQEEGGKKVWCQRPKRASFISTKMKVDHEVLEKCQRPKRASFISTNQKKRRKRMRKMVSTP